MPTHSSVRRSHRRSEQSQLPLTSKRGVSCRQATGPAWPSSTSRSPARSNGGPPALPLALLLSAPLPAARHTRMAWSLLPEASMDASAATQRTVPPCRRLRGWGRGEGHQAWAPHQLCKLHAGRRRARRAHSGWLGCNVWRQVTCKPAARHSAGPMRALCGPRHLQQAIATKINQQLQPSQAAPLQACTGEAQQPTNANHRTREQQAALRQHAAGLDCRAMPYKLVSGGPAQPAAGLELARCEAALPVGGGAAGGVAWRRPEGGVSRAPGLLRDVLAPASADAGAGRQRLGREQRERLSRDAVGQASKAWGRRCARRRIHGCGQTGGAARFFLSRRRQA